MTSSAHDADLKGNNFRRTIHPQSFIAVASLFSELDRGGFRSPPRSRRSKKSPVWIGLTHFFLIRVPIFLESACDKIGPETPKKTLKMRV